MVKLQLTWPHNVGVTITDPDGDVATQEQYIETSLASNQHHVFALKAYNKVIIVPARLLQTALIEITGEGVK